MHREGSIHAKSIEDKSGIIGTSVTAPKVAENQESEFQGPPSEELAELRHPIRRSQLARSNYVDREQGRGSAVATPPINSEGFSLGKLAGACGILLGTAATAALGWKFFQSGITDALFSDLLENGAMYGIIFSITVLPAIVAAVQPSTRSQAQGEKVTQGPDKKSR